MSKTSSRPRPLDPSSCLCFRLRRAARVMTRAYGEALEPLGLTAQQYTLLTQLTHWPDEIPPTIADLAEATGTERTTLSRNLAGMQRAGWIELVPGPDRRERRAELTAAGSEIRAAAETAWRRAQRRMTRRLGDARFRRLLADLEAAVSGAAAGGLVDA